VIDSGELLRVISVADEMAQMGATEGPAALCSAIRRHDSLQAGEMVAHHLMGLCRQYGAFSLLAALRTPLTPVQ
jgi:hypothetical protein